MPRFSSVQAFSDANASMRTVSYDQATGGTTKGSGTNALKTEKVINPYGSSAGAGSGDFHVYRHARNREMLRVQTLQESEKEKQLEMEFQKQLEANKQEEEERTEKRRKKRQRQKDAKRRKKNLAGIMEDEAQQMNGNRADSGGEQDEFKYDPEKDRKLVDGEKGGEAKGEKGSESDIPNDGSFLERMRKQLTEQTSEERDTET